MNLWVAYVQNDNVDSCTGHPIKKDDLIIHRNKVLIGCGSLVGWQGKRNLSAAERKIKQVVNITKLQQMRVTGGHGS